MLTLEVLRTQIFRPQNRLIISSKSCGDFFSRFLSDLPSAIMMSVISQERNLVVPAMKSSAAICSERFSTSHSGSLGDEYDTKVFRINGAGYMDCDTHQAVQFQRCYRSITHLYFYR